MSLKVKNQNVNAFKFLVVEDNPVVQEFLTLMLSKLGLEGDAAGDGQTAVTLYKKYNENYCLILMDLDLPDISGLEVTRIIRSLEKEKKSHIPIVAVTSHYDDPYYREKCFEAGMDGFSDKPNAGQLIHLIKTYCDESVYKSICLDVDTLLEMTSLTSEELLGLLIESSYLLTKAYGLLGDPICLDLAERLVRVRDSLLKHSMDFAEAEKKETLFFNKVRALQ